MAVKDASYVPDEQQLLVFKALADTVRLQIVVYLKQQPEAVTCGQVGQIIGISKTAGSYHFKLLETAGLITVKKIAREKYVTLNSKTFDRYVTNFYELL
ncbi:helix-turn-helix domain-containing protein [Lactobacillus pentosus]|nr:winged helix-turn-helix domain-containing protein [Lactiplantibacillus pentosus]MCH4130655.1 winged helix-turn-helix domain-containing protein [Lactiplantibacillus sp.]MCB5221467.1 winged helix-turn-helix domain-containing protein [Lactiplantibacillus pentosus]MCT3287810.1 ArsR family transcriptional regulator [Lactiplantibacillus pentosus]MCT3291289.1 ArsR family transcriptional regulator [Lactiplantibacillus pentosus]MCT3292929.1 ArsR family transcriptional regulator [Lactiplantibacillus 